MIPQTDRRCKPFLGKKRPGREKSAWRFIPTGRENCPACANALRETLGSSMGGRGGVYAGGGFVGSPAGAPPAGRGCGGFMVWGRMVRGGRPAGAPAEGRGRGRPQAAPTPPQAAARRAVGAGDMLGRGRGGCGGWVGAPQGPARRAGRGRAKPGRRRRRRRTAGPTRPRQKGEWL